MITYCTTEEILDKVGVTDNEISQQRLNRISREATAEVDRIIRTTCDPKTKIETFNGNDKSKYLAIKIPLLSVKNIRIDDTDISMEKVRFNESGRIELLKTAERLYFTSGTKPNVSIKYIYGWIEETNELNLEEDVEKGTQTFEISNAENLDKYDWIKISGIDGYTEWTQITNINKSQNQITCNLIYPHEENSLITKGDVPYIIRKLASVIGGIMGALYMVGSSYTFATSYSIPDYSTTRGVPHPHFSKVLDDLTKERNQLLKEIPAFPVFA